jgi:pyrimidine operon attenuation protein/uracil phosphoribosyltransferase
MTAKKIGWRRKKDKEDKCFFIGIVKGGLDLSNQLAQLLVDIETPPVHA